MNDKKFDPKKLRKLNNPERLNDIPPDYIWNRLDIEKPEVIVEIGAGTAFFCVAFLEKATSSKMYACDIADEAIGYMKEHICSDYPNIIPVKSEENKVPLESNSADLVYMINLHHELDNPTRITGEAFRLLKPEGAVFVVDWQKKAMDEGPPERIRYEPEKVKGDLEQAGFEQITVYNGLPKHYLVVGKKRGSL